MSSKRAKLTKTKDKVKQEPDYYEEDESDGDFDQEDSQDYDDEVDDNEQKSAVFAKDKKKKSKDRKKQEKYQKQLMKKFIDEDADVDHDIDSDREGENKEEQYYSKEMLQRKNHSMAAVADMMEEREQRKEKKRQQRLYEKQQKQIESGIQPSSQQEISDSEDLEDEDVEDQVDEEDMDFEPLPSTNDPRLFQVRVKRNLEKQAVMALLNKSIDFAKRGQPLAILSVTASESTEGWIFVEAFKEVHVREAVKNLTFCLNKIMMLPIDQMPEIYQNEKAQNTELKRHQWVRIKQSGCFQQDIALIEAREDKKVWCRLIPRPELMPKMQSNSFKKSFQRPQQRVGWNPPKDTNEVINPSLMNRHLIEFKKTQYDNGFAFKSFLFKHIDATPNIKPSHEELQMFQSTVSRNPEEHDSREIGKVINKMLIAGGTTIYSKGDKISVIKGELNGIRGNVLSIEEGGLILFKPIDFPELDQPLQVDIQFVCKYFEPGDLVRITEGKYKGETGQVIDVEDRKVSLKLDQSQLETKISTNYLKLKSDSDQVMGHNGIQVSGGAGHGFQAGDLVQFNGNKNAGYVLQVQEDYLKMVSEQGKIVNIKVCDLGKKIPKPRSNGTLTAHDHNNYTLSLDTPVKVSSGPKRGTIGTIRHSFKTYLFLYNKEFVQSNGIFVENSRNVNICGGEFIKGGSGQTSANQNRFIRDQLVGQLVVINQGQFKGHQGRVTYADDRSATVELSSQCKKVPIDKTWCRPIDKIDSGSKHNQHIEMGKTPMAQKTPLYHPQSVWGGNCDDDQDIRAPGSEHYGNHFSMNPEPDMKREKEWGH